MCRKLYIGLLICLLAVAIPSRAAVYQDRMEASYSINPAFPSYQFYSTSIYSLNRQYASSRVAQDGVGLLGKRQTMRTARRYSIDGYMSNMRSTSIMRTSSSYSSQGPTYNNRTTYSGPRYALGLGGDDDDDDDWGSGGGSGAGGGSSGQPEVPIGPPLIMIIFAILYILTRILKKNNNLHLILHTTLHLTLKTTHYFSNNLLPNRSMRKLLNIVFLLSIAPSIWAYDMATEGYDYYSTDFHAKGLSDGTVSIVSWYVSGTTIVFPSVLYTADGKAYEVSQVGWYDGTY